MRTGYAASRPDHRRCVADRDFLSKQEAAHELNRSERYVDALRKSGTLPSEKVAGIVIIPAHAVREFLAERDRITASGSPEPSGSHDQGGA